MVNDEILSKIDDAFENKFIGNYIGFSDEEKNAIYEEVISILLRAANEEEYFVEEKYEKMVVFALVEITKDWTFEEKNWYNFIFKKLISSIVFGDEDYIEDDSFDFTVGSVKDKNHKRNLVISKIYKCINSINEQGKFFLLKGGKRYQNTICCHAFAPKEAMVPFFDLCWQIFCKEYNPDDQDFFSYAAIKLQDKLSCYGTYDDKVVNFCGKAYKFRASLVSLICDNDKTDIFMELLENTISYMDLLFNSKATKEQTYLQRLLHEWWFNKQRELGTEKERCKSTRPTAVRDYKKISTKYRLEDGKAKLIVNPFMLEESYNEPIIKITNRGRVLIDEKVPTHERILSFQTEQLTYDLDSLSLDTFEDLEANIYRKTKCIYSSKNNLKRDVIIFNNGKEVNSQILSPGEYFVYAPTSVKVKFPNEEIVKRNEQSKNLYFFEAYDKDELQINNRIVFFQTEENKKDIFLTTREKQDIFYRENGIDYKIIDGDMFLNISNDYNISDIGIKYNNDFILKLKDFSEEDIDDFKRYNISDIADKGKPFSLTIFRFSDNKILNQLNIIKFSNISINYDKDKNIYYGEDSLGKVEFKTDNYNLNDTFNIDDSEHLIEFNDGEIVYNPPILRWRFDNDKWNNKPSLPLYYNQISNSSMLEIDAPSKIKFDLCIVSSNETIEMLNEKNKFKVGQKIHSMVDTTNVDYVQIVLKTQNQTFDIATIYLKPGFYSNPLDIDSKNFLITWNPTCYVGEKTNMLSLQIFNLKNELVYQRGLNINEIENIDVSSAIKESNYYTLKVILIKKVLFSKKGAEEKEIFKVDYALGDEREFIYKNKVFKIDSVYAFEIGTKKIIPKELKRPIYISDLKYLGSEEGDDIYSGKYFEYVNGRRKYTLSLGNTEIDINPIRVKIKTKGISCYLGYKLDVSDPEFDYENDFSLSRDNSLNFSLKNGSLGIDFYIFKAIKEGDNI